MEILGTIENGLKTSLDVLQFIGSRLVGGAWAETAEKTVHPANIQYINTTGENK